jgi:hypothetical protein
MKFFVFTLLSLIAFHCSLAQNLAPVTGDTITSPDLPPEYRGGDTQLMKDLRKNFKYPKAARKKGMTGTVFVGTILCKDGVLRGLRIIRGIDPECDTVALKMVSKLGKWKPGLKTKNQPAGKPKPVSMVYIFPIKFN